MALAMNACATFQVYNAEQPHRSSYSAFDTEEKSKDLYYRDDADHKENVNYCFWGLVGKPNISVKKVCGGRRIEGVVVSSYRNIGNALGTFFTLGLWVPRSVEVWCD